MSSVHGPADKPVDVGNGRLAASFGSGVPGLLSMARVHPAHGLVELSGAPPFSERYRGDREATRSYRALLASDAIACCWLEGPAGERPEETVADLSEPLRPTWTGYLCEAALQGWAATTPDGAIEMGWRLGGWRSLKHPILRFAGRVGLPTLAEITETDPPPADIGPTLLEAHGPRLVVGRPDIGTRAIIDLDGWAWRVEGSDAYAQPPSSDLRTDRVSLTARFDLDVVGAPATAMVVVPNGGLAHSDRLVARALAYVRGCTALRTAADERVILTDHRLLPLSWTRDAYYQALLLLAAGMPPDVDAVADHLRWLWRRCDRPDGLWARSHHADGRRKDLGFQADQQLYPVLEACDYWRLTGSLPDGVAWTDVIAAAWSRILARIDPETGLLATVENAADDPAAAPFVASSQILLWYAARRLAELSAAAEIGLDAAQLAATADRIRMAFGTSFETQRPWPYAVDGKGASVLYHDANDLPLSLAPTWGFCAPGDEGWRATMAFAWSADNPGWFGGERGGLGSVHTPHPWTLGDVQDWIVGRTLGDDERCVRGVQRLTDVAFADGMLPEAYSAGRQPDVRIRHWFAWPGAAFAALRLLDTQGILDRRLSA